MRFLPLLPVCVVFLLAGCTSVQSRRLTQPESQTVVAHYNNGDPIPAVPESVLIHAFEREFNDGTTVTSVWIEARGSQFWLTARGTRQGRTRSGHFEIVRDAAIPENMYISLRASVRGQIGGWR